MSDGRACAAMDGRRRVRFTRATSRLGAPRGNGRATSYGSRQSTLDDGAQLSYFPAECAMVRVLLLLYV